jgi:hypothetical protein
MSAQVVAFAAEQQNKQATAVQKTAEEQKKMAAAQAELKSSGETWRTTVAAMDASLVASIKTYLEAGVSQSTLATAYGFTATQITAVGKALDEEQKARKLEAKTLEESKARWAEYHAFREARSGSTTERTIADIRRWETEQINSHIKAKTATADF